MSKARLTAAAKLSTPLALFLGICSGLLLSFAFPPIDIKLLVWVGLVPLLLVIERAEKSRTAILAGYVAGFVFFLVTVHPLVSAHAWTGWAVQTRTEFAARMSRQWYFLHGVWVLFCLWGALFWALWAWVLHKFSRKRPWRALLIAPCFWILATEWLRAQTTFGFHWAFLGNATADLLPIRQLAALGGVWILSALIVIFNIGLARSVRRHNEDDWKVSLAAWTLSTLAVITGVFLLGRGTKSENPIKVASIQLYKDRYTTNDFMEIGLDRSYPPMVKRALREEAKLIVLPESIALGTILLDGTESRTKPEHRQIPKAKWDDVMQELLEGRESVLMIGVDSVEKGKDHNTLVAWTREGTVGWYHKRRLVPFSEYIPWGWNRIAIRGESPYFSGRGTQLIRVRGMTLGGFICQEVLIPWVTRESARDGASIFVTGGNDGVFSDAAVAMAHADAAQIRAVETDRYIVRAMKTGISAIIDSQGRELARSQSSEPLLIVSEIAPRTSKTLYVRFGDWMLWFSALVVLGAILKRPGKVE